MADVDLTVTDSLSVQLEESRSLFIPTIWSGAVRRLAEERPLPTRYGTRPIKEW